MNAKVETRGAAAEADTAPAAEGVPGPRDRLEALQFLLVEDSEDDALLLERSLRRAGYAPRCRRVDTREEMRAALEERKWDAVVADYVMPQFSALEALALVKSLGLDLPFIIVSGHISDDTAVAAMKAGAHDYVMKDNLARLGPAVQREMREAEVRQERRREEIRVAAEHGVSRILAGAGSLAEAAPLIMDQLIETLEADLGQLWTLDVERNTLVRQLVRMRRAAEPLQGFVEATKEHQFEPGAGLLGMVWRDGEVRWLADVANGGEFERKEEALKAGLRSATAIPVQSGGTLFCVFELFSRRNLDPARVPLNMLSAISSAIGQFARRRLAEENLRRAHDELEIRVVQRTAQLRAVNVRLEALMAERQRLEQELLEITEKERRRIGLDLHDDLGQKLAGIAMMTKGLELKLGKSGSDAAHDAARIRQAVQEAMSHARDLAHDLATLDVERLDLGEALRDLAARARELFKIACRFTSRGALPSLDPGTVNQLCKIAQEAVTNAIKHGKAKNVGIELTRSGASLVMKVRNDGLPFPELRDRSTGMGLRIMQYRANLARASVDTRANGTRGTIMTCTMPLTGEMP